MSLTKTRAWPFKVLCFILPVTQLSTKLNLTSHLMFVTQALQLDKEEVESKDLKEKDQLEEQEAELSLLTKELL